MAEDMGNSFIRVRFACLVRRSVPPSKRGTGEAPTSPKEISFFRTPSRPAWPRRGRWPLGGRGRGPSCPGARRAKPDGLAPLQQSLAAPLLEPPPRSAPESQAAIERQGAPDADP